MRELSIQEKRNLKDNLAHCSDEYIKFYNGYLEVNKELGFKCNGADTYDHFDWYVAAIKIGTLIECYILQIQIKLNLFVTLMSTVNL